MEVGKINAQARSGIGTGSVRKLRTQGQIPAICYGAGAAPIAVSVDPNALQKALDPVKGRNTLLNMRIEGSEGGPQDVPVLLKDTQRDKLTGKLVHADFLRVRMDHPVRVTVPIVITGKSEGVKAGGTLHQVYRSLTVLASPDKIPTKVEIDVTTLGIGQSIHVADLKLESGIAAGIAAGTTLCVVTAPKAEKAEAAAEGGEAAAAGEGEAKKDAKAPAKAAPAKAAPAKAAPAKAAPAKGK